MAAFRSRGESDLLPVGADVLTGLMRIESAVTFRGDITLSIGDEPGLLVVVVVVWRVSDVLGLDG